ncbi:flavin reductase family protein [Streptomyces sp. NPDC005791]|uniref:flavin reductase family protein n=1 Tax=Streptomyces sp. NPDC005791 TaxID=3364732 RepID=UPI00369C9940
MFVDAADLDAKSAYKLLIGGIIPRAIAWVSTESVDGVGNLAPVSFFTAVGRKPPMLSISLQPRSDGVTLKDTFINIRDTGEFVVNTPTLPLADQLHRSAFEFDSDVDEFTALGLETEASQVVRPRRVKDTPVAFECKVNRVIPVEGSLDHVVWGEVVRFYVRDDLYLERGCIDTGAIPAVGRLAAEYTLVNTIFTTPLDDNTVDLHAGRRMHRLDDHSADWSPIDTDAWSPSGSTMSEGPKA